MKLDGAQHKVLDEALRRGEDLREKLESALTAYGRWILEAVFGNDATAALDEKTKNPVWLELVRRAGGPTLRINRHLLYVSISIAANDKRINDQSWRGLDGARKELLLPLREAPALREAAQHVAKFNLTQAKTREYVTALLADAGRKRQVRMTPSGLESRVRKLREGLDGVAVSRRVAAMEMDGAQKQRLASELRRLRELLTKMERALK